MFQKFKQCISKFLKDGDYEESEGGILVHRGLMIKGEYFDSVNGGDERIHPNLLPSEGILFILNVALGATAKAAGFYLAPYSGAVTPAANWTAANFVSNATEITSTTEGYAGATRKTWTAAAAAAGSIDNLAAKASYTITATTTINVNGSALLTDNTRGGTAGALISASRYASTRVLANGDVWECGYRVTLTDS